VKDWSDPDLFLYLGSVILKMYHSDKYPVKLLDPKRNYIMLTQRSWYWTIQSPSVLDYSTMPARNTRYLLLLRNLAKNLRGFVWLACDTNGKVCVLKFEKENNEARLEREKNAWKTIWPDIPVHLEKWDGKPALWLPFFKSLSEAEFQKQKAAVEEVVQKLEVANITYEKPSFRNVGFFQTKDRKLKAVFFGMIHREPSLEIPLQDLTIS